MAGGGTENPWSIGSYFLLQVIAVLLHSLGIYCLNQQRDRRDNQKILLCNLSVVEISMVITYSLIAAPTFSTWDRDTLHGRIVLAVDGGVNIMFYFAMFSITIDRLMALILQARYRVWFTYQRTRRITLTQWVLAAVYSVIVYFTAPVIAHEGMYTYGFVILNSTFVCVAIVTYSAIGISLFLSRKKFNHKKKTLSRENIVPSLIVLTYFLFYAIPDVVLYTIKKNSSAPVPFEINLIWSIGFISDSVMYIFVHNRTRKIALNVLFCKSCRGISTQQSVSESYTFASDVSKSHTQKEPRDAIVSYDNYEIRSKEFIGGQTLNVKTPSHYRKDISCDEIVFDVNQNCSKGAWNMEVSKAINKAISTTIEEIVVHVNEERYQDEINPFDNHGYNVDVDILAQEISAAIIEDAENSLQTPSHEINVSTIEDAENLLQTPCHEIDLSTIEYAENSLQTNSQEINVSTSVDAENLLQTPSHEIDVSTSADV